MQSNTAMQWKNQFWRAPLRKISRKSEGARSRGVLQPPMPLFLGSLNQFHHINNILNLFGIKTTLISVTMKLPIRSTITLQTINNLHEHRMINVQLCVLSVYRKYLFSFWPNLFVTGFRYRSRLVIHPHHLVFIICSANFTATYI